MMDTVKLVLFYIGIGVLCFLAGSHYRQIRLEKVITLERQNIYYTYFFPSPEVIDPIVNAVNDEVIYGELDIGVCINTDGLDALSRYVDFRNNTK